MQQINALSLAPDVNEWLAKTRHLRILHIFDTACNLINEHGDVLSIVAPQIGNGPFNLVIDGAVVFPEHLNIESPVSIPGTRLILGHVTIDTETAELWDPHPDWEGLHTKKDSILAQMVTRPIANYEQHGGFEMSLREHTGLLNHRGLPIPPSLIADLSSALAGNDISTAKAITSRLAGLGIGLTPSGDDVIVGAIHAAWIIHPSEIASVLTRGIAHAAAPLTTSLSAAYLKSAGRGKAGELWHHFFDALTARNNADIKQTAEKILAVGETSGADALAGFIGTLKAYMALPSRKEATSSTE